MSTKVRRDGLKKRAFALTSSQHTRCDVVILLHDTSALSGVIEISNFTNFNFSIINK